MNPSLWWEFQNQLIEWQTGRDPFGNGNVWKASNREVSRLTIAVLGSLAPANRFVQRWTAQPTRNHDRGVKMIAHRL